MKNVINHSNFSIDNVCKLVAEAKSFTDQATQKPVKYTEAPYNYNYSVDDGTVVEDLLRIQFPKMISTGSGIEIPTLPTDKPTLKCELLGESGRIVDKIFTTIYDYSIDWAVEHASDLGNFGRNLKSKEAADALFAKPVFYRTRDGGAKSPLVYFKFHYVKGELATSISLPSPTGGIKVPLEFLQNRPFEFVPTLYFRRVYIGSKGSVQSCIDNIIVSNIFETVSAPVEDLTMKNLAEENPGLFGDLASKLNSWKGGSSSSPVPLTITPPQNSPVKDNSSDLISRLADPVATSQSEDENTEEVNPDAENPEASLLPVPAPPSRKFGRRRD